jgi:hypothetical protein
MAKDMKGNFHRAGFQARKADRMDESMGQKSMDDEAQPEPEQDAGGDHMHMAAEAMHAAEPASKHMIVSHDGYGMKSHGIDEQGNHKETEEHNSAEEADEAMHKFFGEEANEPQHQHGDGEEPEENQSLY